MSQDSFQKLFDMFAANNGSIQSLELGKAIRLMGINPSEEEMDNVMDNARGTVDLPRFLELARDLLGERTGGSDGLRQAFQAFDPQDTGKLNAKSADFRHALKVREVDSDAINTLLQDAGADGSGRFDYNNFVDSL